MALSERAQTLLNLLVTQYLESGQPVPSGVLAQAMPSKLSAATVRAVLSDLESQGFLSSPHTSSGRIPTLQGLRFFVRGLVAAPLKTESMIEELQSRLVCADPSALFASVSETLSELSACAGLVRLPNLCDRVLQHIEFVPLARRRILVVLVFEDGTIENRVIDSEEDYRTSELERAASFLNQGTGSLVDRYTLLLSDLKKSKEALDTQMILSLRCAEEALGPLLSAPADGSLVIRGQSKLLQRPPSSMQSLEHLFRVFDEQRSLLKLLERCVYAPGVQVFMGEDAGLQDWSLVAAPYRAQGGRCLGVIGVIGPQRMSYERVITLVGLTAEVLSTALAGPDSRL